MSKITEILLPEGFEYVRDRIAEILADEFDHQYYLTGDVLFDLKDKVYVERSVAFDREELSAINVSVGSGTYGSKHQAKVFLLFYSFYIIR